MPRRALPICFAILMAVAAASPARAGSEAETNATIDKVLGDHVRYETAVKAFQQAVVAGRRQDVAAFVRYPIVVTINGRERTIKSAEAFVAAYDGIMTPDIVEAVKDQAYDDLLVNSDGIMFGLGEVWIDGICLDRACKSFLPKVVTIQHTDVN